MTTVFVVLAALLTLAVLVVVLRPVWHAQRRTGALVVTTLAVATGLLYVLIGTPAALGPAPAPAEMTMADAIAGLEADLAREPTRVEGWRLLARAYAATDPAKARDALARAARLAPDDADVQVDYAEARALADPARRFDAGAVALLRGALDRDPRHQRARWFLGIAQRQSGQAAEAAATWEPLLAQVDASTAAALRPQLDAARAEAGLPPLPASTVSAGPASPDAPPAAVDHALQVRVALDPEFAARVRLRGDSTVFVIARVPGGPPMPVAVEKHPLQALPLQVVLDDGDAAMPTLRLSGLREVEVFARLSASGDASRQDGDIESTPVRVTLPATAPVELVLGR